MIIQTILLDPSEAIWTDKPSNVSSLDPSGAIQADTNHPTRTRKVDSSPTPLRYVEVRLIDSELLPFMLCARPAGESSPR
jgi:hypothetical protein